MGADRAVNSGAVVILKPLHARVRGAGAPTDSGETRDRAGGGEGPACLFAGCEETLSPCARASVPQYGGKTAMCRRFTNLWSRAIDIRQRAVLGVSRDTVSQGWRHRCRYLFYDVKTG